MASTLSPFERSLSARRTSPVPMSMPHIILEASVSRAASSRHENLQSGYGFHRRSGSKHSRLHPSDLPYSAAASSRTRRTSSSGRGSLDIPALIAAS